MYYWQFSEPNAVPRKTVVVDCAIHPREWLTPYVCTYTAQQLATASVDLLRHYDVYIMPVLNVDGYLRTWAGEPFRRKNVRPCDGVETNTNVIFPIPERESGVDLNRNWPPTPENGGTWELGLSYYCLGMSYSGASAGSEPETQAIMNFWRNKPDVFAYFTIHTFGADIFDVTVEDKSDLRYAVLKQQEAAMTNVSEGTQSIYVGVISADSGWSTNYFRNTKRAYVAQLFEMRPAFASSILGFKQDESQIILAAQEGWAGIRTALDAYRTHSSTCDEAPTLSTVVRVFRAYLSGDQVNGNDQCFDADRSNSIELQEVVQTFRAYLGASADTPIRL